MNLHAQALGRLGKGKRKTLSKAALEQRQNAAQRKRIRVCKQSILEHKEKIGHESVSVV